MTSSGTPIFSDSTWAMVSAVISPPGSTRAIDFGGRGQFIAGANTEHRDAGVRPSLVHQVNGLIRQLVVAVEADGQVDRRLQRLVGDLHLVVLFPFAAQTLENFQRLLGRGLIDDDLLEAPLEGRIGFDVAAVFGDGGGADAAQVAARQGRLDQSWPRPCRPPPCRRRPRCAARR